VIDDTGVPYVACLAAFCDASLGMHHAIELPLDDDTDAVGYGVDHPVFWPDRVYPHSATQHTAFAAGTWAPPSRAHPQWKMSEPNTREGDGT
jgi:hypothetical protein